MILVTGAGGKSGLAVLRALARIGVHARALVHRNDQIGAAQQAGAAEAFSGDLLDKQNLVWVMLGVESIYHICPNMHPQELEIGLAVIAAAKAQRVGHLVYHSVLHPQTEAMPHHWLKLKVEDSLLACGLPFTILQPCAYMQNIQGYWSAILKDGIYALPYSAGTRISMVDLEDVAEAAARVLTETGHENAIYELAGPEPLSQSEAAETMANALGRTVTVQEIDRTAWKENVAGKGMPAYTVETLLKMFHYYEDYGFCGNPRVLEWLLGRKPRTFKEYIHRVISGE